MNTFFINDEGFKNSEVYKDYLKDNPSIGFLKIRAYTANEAVPIKGVSITVKKEIEGADVVFFRGVTDESGIIEKIPLPAPKLDDNNLEVPNYTKYEVIASLNKDSTTYVVNIYENIYVTQTINVVPKMGDNIGY